MARVRVRFKKQLRVDHLNFKQFQMLKLATVGVAAVKNRVQAALGSGDGPALPLTRRYAIRKSRMRLGNRRNLTFTGAMLRNLQVRTVSERDARVGLSGRKDRIKALANERIEPWLTFSPRDQQATVTAAQRIFSENAKRFILTS